MNNTRPSFYLISSAVDGNVNAIEKILALYADLQSCFQKTEHLLSMVTLIVWMRLQEILTAKS